MFTIYLLYFSSICSIIYIVNQMIYNTFKILGGLSNESYRYSNRKNRFVSVLFGG